VRAALSSGVRDGGRKSPRGPPRAPAAASHRPLAAHVVEADSMIERESLTAHHLAGRSGRLEPSPSATHREDYSSARGESSSGDA